MFYIAGNWKMNKTLNESQIFFTDLNNWLNKNNFDKITVMVFPPALFVNEAVKAFKNTKVVIGTQNISQHEKGAYTGEISCSQVKSVLATSSIIGHSERRAYYNETDEIINEKFKALQANDLTAVVCIGETLEQRKAEQTNEVLEKQLAGAFKDITNCEKVIVAYEPVWAIGTGLAATPQMAEETHSFVKTWLKNKFNQNIPVLYGGSVKPANIKQLLEQPSIDGGLIGGASLKAESFCEMIKIANTL